MIITGAHFVSLSHSAKTFMLICSYAASHLPAVSCKQNFQGNILGSQKCHVLLGCFLNHGVPE